MRALSGLVAIGFAFGCQGWVKESGPDPVAGAPTHGVLDCAGPLSIRIFRADTSFATEWSPVANRLAFNKKTADGYYNLFTSLPDGSDEKPLTYQNPHVPGKHACTPVWTPDGQYIVFGAEKKSHGRSSTDAICGFGAYSDIWVIRADGTSAWPLTDVPNDYDHGAMIPRLSRDGKSLLWSERIGAPNLLSTAETFGSWVLKVTALSFANGEPRIDEPRLLQPGARGFYEGADFTPDGRGVLFTSSLATGSAWTSQIFVVDLASGHVTELTTNDYNEHGRYTPDGTQILYMSSTAVNYHGTDWWLMNPDGTNRHRLTSFEVKGNPQSSGTALYPGTVAWDPTGRWFIGDIETNLVSQSYTRVRVTCP